MIIQKIKKVEFIKEFKIPGRMTFNIGTQRDMGILNGDIELYIGCCGYEKKYTIPKDYFKIIE